MRQHSSLSPADLTAMEMESSVYQSLPRKKWGNLPFFFQQKSEEREDFSRDGNFNFVYEGVGRPQSS